MPSVGDDLRLHFLTWPFSHPLQKRRTFIGMQFSCQIGTDRLMHIHQSHLRSEEILGWQIADSRTVLTFAFAINTACSDS